MRFARLFSIEELNCCNVFDVILRTIVYVILITFFFLFSLSSVHGATSNFVARTLVGSDTIAPSVPTGLTATPIATSQINLVWGTSTDDYLFGGYHVYRDDVQIATTTSAFYEDTGLQASTLYTYAVTAFDSFGNFSASSSPVSTTTLASSTSPVATSSLESSTFGSRSPRAEIVSLRVIPTETGATIRYETSEYVRSLVKWGVTSSYEAGGSREGSFRLQHELTITDLRPDTRYRFVIEGEDNRGRYVFLGEHAFRTLPSVDTVSPGVVTGLTLVRNGTDVRISWENPTDADFEFVRVVRSDRFYPSTEVEGWVVYEGEKEYTEDEGVAIPGASLFYTVFAYDTQGNISAGSVALLRISEAGLIEIPPSSTTSVSSSTVPSLTFSDLQFFQDDERVPIRSNTVTLDGSRHVTIAVPYGLLPEHLKTILVRIVPQHDSQVALSFILRVNENKTAYIARLAPLGVTGTFTIFVSVFDFETKEVGSLSGTFLVTLGSGVQPGGSRKEIPTPYSLEIWHGVILLFLLVLIFILVYRLLIGKDGERELSSALKKHIES